ncbi:DUF1801 domain-containing protein [Jeotgalicoccus meleagridis]|jgi:hypothetical protein|uniref:Intracellular iron chaperone frataxin n=1 Tax=Jeotgalicoccus meleagridis TaxID=2759181 RepID=A0A6V7R044_9STAP|nr:DUF1801 domain-containing protein [Jeotgalicoccus meleagridis]CAD2070680.1 Intracellular iron chaperone frataxin [Jeotgalicoccus meleagridis]
MKDIFKKSIDSLDETKQEKLKEVFDWIEKHYPEFEGQVKWSTPLYVKDGSFMIGIKPSKHHFSVNPEAKGIEKFSEKIKNAGYSHEKMTYKVKYTDDMNYDLLKEIIDFNIEDKKHLDTFWR